MNGPPSNYKSPIYFFTYIPPGCISQVSIPIAFRKYVKRIRKTKPAILKRGNQRWPVKINENWVFGDGWEDFVKENGVEDCDFVVFKHEGNMVFDLTWCEKQYPIQNVIHNPYSTSVITWYEKDYPTQNVIQNPYFKSIVRKYGIENTYTGNTVRMFSVRTIRGW